MKNLCFSALSALSIVFALSLQSCKNEEVPEVTTTSVIYATASALGGGNVTSDGGASVAARGVCWNDVGNPTTADDKTTDGSGTGTFASAIEGLTPNTTYFVRAYATNSEGTTYGNEIEFTTYGVLDADDNGYHTVIIGDQEWMKENLKTTSYSDGSAIPKITDTEDWVSTLSGAYCEYENNSNNGETYGNLYNWPAASDFRNVCPVGWHTPSVSDWDILTNTLGGETTAGGALKSTGTLGAGDGLWNINVGATNSSEFTGLPGGTRFDDGVFLGMNSYGNWWSADGAADRGWSIRLQNDNTNVEQYYNYSYIGHSVRCVKD